MYNTMTDVIFSDWKCFISGSLLQVQQDGAVGAKISGWLPRHYRQKKWWVETLNSSNTC
jgi:hypothetical protein